MRGGTQGSKKRYAGLVNGQLEVVGLEAVRRDWPALARRLQRGMLERVFRDEPVAPFVREVVAEVRAGRLDGELVIRKALRKGAVERYTARDAAARPGGAQGGARDRPRRALRDHARRARARRARRASCRPSIDRAHYVERVLRPIADAILAQLGQSFDEALGAPRQLSLL